MKYSVIGIGISFAIGIVIGSVFALPPFHLWIACISTAVLVLLLHRMRRETLAGLLICVALLGAIRYQSLPSISQSLYVKANNLTQITGTVVDYPEERPGHTLFTIAPDNLPANVYVTLFWKAGPPQILYGDRLRLTGSAKAPEDFDDFDYRAYLARQGIFATMVVNSPDDIRPIGIGGNRLIRLGDALRQRLLARVDWLLPEAEAGLAHGLLFGEKGMIPPAVEDAFRRVGLMHLLAVSGLHLGIFLAVLWFVLRLFGLRPRVTYPIVGIAVLGILWLIGPRVSLVRAALLFAFLALGSVLSDLGLILKRWVNSYAGLAAAGLVILAIRPTALWDVGFQLSFAATAAIMILFDPRFRVRQAITEAVARGRIPNAILSYILFLITVSAAAQAGTAPLLAYHFHALYPLSILSSLVAIPLATLALWGGIAMLMLAWTPLATAAATVLRLILSGIIHFVEIWASFPVSEIPVQAWTGVWIGGMVVFMFMIVFYRRASSSCTLYSTSITPSSPAFAPWEVSAGARK